MKTAIGGRPRIEIDLTAVKRLASMMCTGAEIAMVLGISERSITRYKKLEDVHGRVELQPLEVGLSTPPGTPGEGVGAARPTRE